MAAMLAASHPSASARSCSSTASPAGNGPTTTHRHARGDGREAGRALPAALGRDERDPRPHCSVGCHDPRFRSWYSILAADDAPRRFEHDVSLGDGHRRSPDPAEHPGADARPPSHGTATTASRSAATSPTTFRSAKYVELPGVDSLPFHAGDFVRLWTRSRIPHRHEASPFTIGGWRRCSSPTRRLDADRRRAWGQRLDQARHSDDSIVREHLRAYRGREWTTRRRLSRDFDGPARAVTCAARHGRVAPRAGSDDPRRAAHGRGGARRRGVRGLAVPSRRG